MYIRLYKRNYWNLCTDWNCRIVTYPLDKVIQPLNNWIQNNKNRWNDNTSKHITFPDLNPLVRVIVLCWPWSSIAALFWHVKSSPPGCVFTIPHRRCCHLIVFHPAALQTKRLITTCCCSREKILIKILFRQKLTRWTLDEHLSIHIYFVSSTGVYEPKKLPSPLWLYNLE